MVVVVFVVGRGTHDTAFEEYVRSRDACPFLCRPARGVEGPPAPDDRLRGGQQTRGGHDRPQGSRHPKRHARRRKAVRLQGNK